MSEKRKPIEPGQVEITIKGETRSYSNISEMCSKLGISKSLYMRKRKYGNLSVQDAVEAALKESKKSDIANARKEFLSKMGDRMLELRDELSGNDALLEQSQMGEILGMDVVKYNKPISMVMVSHVENGRRAYDADVYIALTKFTGNENTATVAERSIDYMFGFTDVMTRHSEVIDECIPYAERLERALKKRGKEKDIVSALSKGRSIEAKAYLAYTYEISLDYLLGITNDDEIITK